MGKETNVSSLRDRDGIALYAFVFGDSAEFMVKDSTVATYGPFPGDTMLRVCSPDGAVRVAKSNAAFAANAAMLVMIENIHLPAGETLYLKGIYSADQRVSVTKLA